MNLILFFGLMMCGKQVLCDNFDSFVIETEAYKKINELYLDSSAGTVTARKGKFLWGFDFHYGFRHPEKQYDYVIVGAGVAGCVLANRLTENPNITVLLLEAGKAEIPLASDIPLSSAVLQSTDFNYGYVTEPQTKACLGLDEHRCSWPHGRGLGGSSIISNLIYSRGNKHDYDSWSQAGNPGWSYDDVLPYFKKIETANIKDFQFNNFHGFDGPVPVEDVPFRSKIARKFVKSAKAVGHEYTDVNSDKQLGVSYVQQNSKNGKRMTAARAYLEPVANRRNLHILQFSRATKVVIDKDTMTAKGVKFLLNQQELYVIANKEVILSAGSFESPRLLMLSGVGPAEHLKSLHIDVIKDLPVGQTLFDHVGVIGPIFIVNKPIDNMFSLDHIINLDTFSQLSVGRGVLTANGVESLVYMNSGLSDTNDVSVPDIELDQKMATVSFDTGPGLKLAYRLKTSTYNAVFRPLMNKRAFHLVPILLRPRSKGFIELRSNRSDDHPTLQPNYFEDDRDLETLVIGIEEAIKIVSQKSFEKIETQLYKANVPGCEQLQFNTHDYWRCYVMHMTTSLHAQVGVCKMGPESDPTTVVDHKLRVHGFKNLRVVDAGIIPTPPTGHVGAYVYLIGERAADFIKESWHS